MNIELGTINLTEIIAIMAIVGMFVGLYIHSDNKWHASNARFDAKFDANDAKFNASIARQDAFDARFEKMLEKIHNIELEIRDIKLYKSKE